MRPAKTLKEAEFQFVLLCQSDAADYRDYEIMREREIKRAMCHAAPPAVAVKLLLGLSPRLTADAPDFLQAADRDCLRVAGHTGTGLLWTGD